MLQLFVSELGSIVTTFEHAHGNVSFRPPRGLAPGPLRLGPQSHGPCSLEGHPTYMAMNTTGGIDTVVCFLQCLVVDCIRSLQIYAYNFGI